MEVLSEVIQSLIEESKDNYLNQKYTEHYLQSLAFESRSVYMSNAKYANIKPGDKFFIEAQFLSYSLMFEDRYEKLDFCNNYINKTEHDGDGLFIDLPNIKNDLLLIFKVERDSLRRVTNNVDYIDDYLLDFHEIFGQIKKNNDTIAELQKGMNILLDIVKSNKRKGKKTTKILRYKDIFINENIAVELKDLFKRLNFTDNSGSWIGHTGTKNELAIAYYILKEPTYNFQLIKTGSKKPQLISLYHEFGLQVSEQLNQNEYTSIRNLTTEPTRGDTHEEFIRIFKPLLKLKN